MERLAALIDDDEDSRLLERVLLERAGYGVAEFDSGEAALRALPKLRPQLVLFDYRLSGMDGIGFVGRARQLGLPSTTLVSVTGSVMPEQRAALLAAGATAVISKPIDTRAFVATVERAMRPLAGAV